MIVIVEDKPENSAPVAVISLPKSGNDYYSDEAVTLSSQGSFDPNDDSISLNGLVVLMVVCFPHNYSYLKYS